MFPSNPDAVTTTDFEIRKVWIQICTILLTDSVNRDKVFISLFHSLPVCGAGRHTRTSPRTVSEETVEAAAHRGSGRELLGASSGMGKRGTLVGLGLHSPQWVIKAILVLFLLKVVDGKKCVSWGFIGKLHTP